MTGRADFEARLRRVGAERYHDKHPFNLRMHAGELGEDEIRLWVGNRYYYQTRIPIKDGLILAKSGDPAFRRQWIHRIQDHDGAGADPGGLELWLALAEAVGLSREEVAAERGILPGVRRACDAYVAFVDSHDLLESVASSLTEMFAGDIMATRIAAFERHYPWVKPDGLRYFRTRTSRAPADAAEGLAFVLGHATSVEDQERCIAALERKCEILWSLLDAVEGAFTPLRISSHAQVREDEALVVLPERAVQLNPTGASIVGRCDGSRSAFAIARELRRVHPGADDVEGDVYRFLDEMQRAGAIEPAA